MNKSFRVSNICEFDSYAAVSYCAIHSYDNSLNLGDITKVDETSLEPFTMIVGGSPCQDFSVAGKQKGSTWKCTTCNHEYNPLTVHWSERDKCPSCGGKELDKTRSSLLVEWLRIIRFNKPKFGIYENVKNIVGKEFKETTFKLFEEELHEYGYNTYWKVLNAKNYGIPQNRERVYLILIQKDEDNGKFKFPEPFDNGLRLKDFLEDEVDEKFYIDSDKATKLIKNLIDSGRLPEVEGSFIAQKYGDRGTDNYSVRDYAHTIPANPMSDRGQLVIENEVRQLGNIVDSKGNWTNPQRGRIYSKYGCSPALNCVNGGGQEPKVLIGSEQKNAYFGNGDISSTLTASMGTGGGHVPMIGFDDAENDCADNTICKYAIRKLTPLECFRLMGFDDSDYYKAKYYSEEEVEKLGLRKLKKNANLPSDYKFERMSNSQLYKQTGNSIVVDVLYYILIELYKAMPYLFDDLVVGSYFSGIGAFEKALEKLFDAINSGNFTLPQMD